MATNNNKASGRQSVNYEGRLELTWTNKPLRLLAHEDGSYEWVPPSDYRVAEVRLLHDAGVVGEVHGTRDRANDNLLIRGDALNALTSLIELPEFEREYAGQVKLAYLSLCFLGAPVDLSVGLIHVPLPCYILSQERYVQARRYVLGWVVPREYKSQT